MGICKDSGHAEWPTSKNLTLFNFIIIIREKTLNIFLVIGIFEDVNKNI